MRATTHSKKKVTYSRSNSSVDLSFFNCSASLPCIGKKFDHAFEDFWASYLESYIVEKSNNGIKIWDLFSGVGGLAVGVNTFFNFLGLKTNVILASDIDHDALNVHRENFGTKYLDPKGVTGMVEFDYQEYHDEINLLSEPRLKSPFDTIPSPDLIIAGPPCQGHSRLNNHTRHDDPKNFLYIYPAIIGLATGAKTIVIENVSGVTADKSNIVQKTHSLLRKNGYSVTSFNLSLPDFGWPQTRKRYFTVASRGHLISLSKVSEYFIGNQTSVEWLLDLVDDKDDIIAAELSEENQSRIDYLFDNNLFDLPNHERPKCHRNGTTYNSSYGRMSLTKSAPTITTGFMSPGRGRFIHPNERRTISINEALLIQGFPKSFELLDYSSTKLAKWIGNAVPPYFGFIVMNTIIGQFKDVKGHDLDGQYDLSLK